MEQKQRDKAQKSANYTCSSSDCVLMFLATISFQMEASFICMNSTFFPVIPRTPNLESEQRSYASCKP